MISYKSVSISDVWEMANDACIIKLVAYGEYSGVSTPDSNIYFCLTLQSDQVDQLWIFVRI